VAKADTEDFRGKIMSNKKPLKYYLNLPWSFTIEQEGEKTNRYYIIRVNELPGICTDAETVEEGMELIKEAIEAAIKLYLKNGEAVPEPVKKSEFKGNIAYRTTSERHYNVYRARLGCVNFDSGFCVPVALRRSPQTSVC
jgi:predicted RNase H-like HicB family nuclease